MAKNDINAQDAALAIPVLLDEMVDRKGRSGKVGGGRSLVRFVADVARRLEVDEPTAIEALKIACRSKLVTGDPAKGFQTPAYTALIAGEREAAKTATRAKVQTWNADVAGKARASKAEIMARIKGSK